MSDFQHRHYKAIAALLAEMKEGDHPHKIKAAFCAMFERDNPNFSVARFVAAANGQPCNGRDKVKAPAFIMPPPYK